VNVLFWNDSVNLNVFLVSVMFSLLQSNERNSHTHTQLNKMCIKQHSGACLKGGACIISDCHETVCKRDIQTCSHCKKEFQICEKHDREFHTKANCAPLCIECVEKQQAGDSSIYRVAVCLLPYLHGYGCEFSAICQKPECTTRICQKSIYCCAMKGCKKDVVFCESHNYEVYDVHFCYHCLKDMKVM